MGGSVTVFALPVTDTCKEVENGFVRRTVLRDDLVYAVGPWLIDRDQLSGALEGIADNEPIGSVLELARRTRLRVRVHRV